MRKFAAVLLAAFALAFGMGTASAFAAESAVLAAGVGTQDAGGINVWVQDGDGAEPQLVHTFTKSELSDLARSDSTDAVSALYGDHANGGMKVCSTTSYVKLDTIAFEAAARGKKRVPYDDLTGISVTSGAFAPDSVPLLRDIRACCYFYPDLPNDGTYNDAVLANAAAAPAVIALTANSKSFADVSGATKASDLESYIKEHQSDISCPRFVYGIAERQITDGTARGNRLTQGVTDITFIDHKGELESVAAIAEQTYAGKALTPALSVKGTDGAALVEGKDYTATYSNNAAVGTAKVEIVGKGLYLGSLSATFTIKSAPAPKAETNTAPVNTTTTTATAAPKTVVQAPKTTTPNAASKANASNAKKAQKLKAKNRTQKASAKTLKKKKLTYSAKKLGKLTGAKTKVTYTGKATKGKKSATRYITVSKKGTITLKKGTPKGTYKVKVTAKAAAGKSYKAAKKTFTITFKVK